MAHTLKPSPITSGVLVGTRPMVITYKDTGCEYAHACLTCPFSICYYDDPRAFREELGHRLEGRFGGSRQAQ